MLEKLTVVSKTDDDYPTSDDLIGWYLDGSDTREAIAYFHLLANDELEWAIEEMVIDHVDDIFDKDYHESHEQELRRRNE